MIIFVAFRGDKTRRFFILQIKKKNVHNVKKQKLINKELTLLKTTLRKSIKPNKDIKVYLNKLIVANTKLWKIEDDIRECERKKNFGKEFIKLARAVYFTNDERSKIKFTINKKFGSKIAEVKSYKKY